jgi:AcrR family transcriptional regulator
VSDVGDERVGREQKKAIFRQRILEAARGVFFRDGFIDANLDEVAQIAGVAKGTLYRYFDNKGELYVAVLDRLRSVGRFYFDHWTRNREYFQIFWALENQAVIGELPPGVVEEVTRLWENCLRILAGVIEEGMKEGCFAPCDAWEVANILWTVANGLIQTEHVTPRRELRRSSLDRVFDDMIEIFVRGLAQPA